MLILAGLVMGAEAIALWRHESNATPPPIVQVLSPGEVQAPAPIAKPSRQQVESYRVAPTLPRYISIPKLGIEKVRVLALGVLSDGHIATPGSSYDTGWYDKSAKPGQPGAMFIDGHVAGWGTGGIFYSLHTLRPGDKITIIRGDSKAYVYAVVSQKTYPADNVDMNAVLSPINPGKPGLNLMTCTWDVVGGKSVFKNRTVVFASLES
ncbi:MAG TPA: class F sortase [Candidatus Saccharimonadales bacterium]|nr:class F sortase [Candidatus Saccharimonadales bacterium]